MREYRTESYKKKLAGNKFFSSDSDLKKYDGMRVETARLNGKIIGRPKGQHSVSEREVRAKRQMMKSVRSVGDDIKK